MQTETTSKRRNFDEAFKREAVALLSKGDKAIKQLAQELRGLPLESARLEKVLWPARPDPQQ